MISSELRLVPRDSGSKKVECPFSVSLSHRIYKSQAMGPDPTGSASQDGSLPSCPAIHGHGGGPRPKR